MRKRDLETTKTLFNAIAAHSEPPFLIWMWQTHENEHWQKKVEKPYIQPQKG